ncbi:MAG: hypothetical protein AB2552_20230 [Candidatus Thiodiazotropha endolucinida]
MIFPSWHDPLSVPTVDDTITTKYELSFNSEEGIRRESLLYIQPKSLDDNLTERGQDIKDLLNYNHVLTEKLLAQYLSSNISSAISAEMKGNLKNILENYRSLLEYVSHYMAGYCNPQPDPKKIQFPIANLTDTERSFSKKIDKWFPGLGNAKPRVKEFLLLQQHFNGENWLNDLAELTNINKHRALSRPVLKEFESTVISYQGAGIRLGNMGISWVKVLEGGSLKFIGEDGGEAFIKGPCTLTVDNVPETTFDPCITVTREVHSMHHVAGTNSSLAHIIWVISKNVYRSVSTICGRLS